jgi:hypothetical protein
MSLDVNGRVRHNTSVAVFLVPDTPMRTQYGTIDGNCPPGLLPWLHAAEQILTQAGNLAGKPVRKDGKPAQGASRRIAATLHQQRTQVLHLGGRLVEHNPSKWTVGNRLTIIITNALRNRRSE